MVWDGHELNKLLQDVPGNSDRVAVKADKSEPFMMETQSALDCPSARLPPSLNKEYIIAF